MSEEEKEAIEYWKRDIEFYHYNTQLASEHYAQILLNLIDKLQKENTNAKWYIHQMIVRLNEDIEDYIFDNSDINKNIVGELKEQREQWKDIEKLLNGESKDNLYNDWRKYGEYE